MDNTNVSDARRHQNQLQHIFAVNHDPEFLDIVRVLLQGEMYNVTTTNYVPRTCFGAMGVERARQCYGCCGTLPGAAGHGTERWDDSGADARGWQRARIGQHHNVARQHGASIPNDANGIVRDIPCILPFKLR